MSDPTTTAELPTTETPSTVAGAATVVAEAPPAAGSESRLETSSEYVEPAPVGLSGLQWTMMGFAVGLVCGALVLIRYQMTPAAARTPARPVVTTPAASTIAADMPTAVVPDPIALPASEPAAVSTDEEHDALQAELRRLRREVEKQRLRAELKALQQELAGLDEATTPAPLQVATTEAPRAALPPAEPTPEARPEPPEAAPAAPRPGARTLEFWNAMNDIIAQEEIMRAVPTGGITAGSAGEFLNRRIAAARFAADAIKKLATDAVDPQAVEFAGTLADWYADGVTINEQGKRLLEQENAETRRGPAGVQWQTAYKQHEQRVQGINAAGARVRDAMQIKYEIEFPPLR